MKVAERVLEVSGNMGGEKVGMTIDQSALAHIMSVLTDLYSDPEMAVIREYSTNAFDSHVEAGVSRPIEVTLPTNLAPFFRVRDFGVGLDAEDIREIYSRYGTSTKRQSDDVVGMLGLGCKSALTYTDQFTLVGIKDGVMVQVSVSRDEDGAGSMTIVANEETDQPDGVEVIVPAKYGNQFEKKAGDFFRFWEKGKVLVNGKEPKRVDGIWIADDILMTKDVDRSYVVMGNVAYPHPDAAYAGGWHNVCFVGIGEVHFTPSRESLQLDSHTKQTLHHLRERIVKERNAALDKQIQDSKTPADAVRMWLTARSMGYSGAKPTYKGKDIPQQSIRYDFLSVPARSRWGRAKGMRTPHFNIQMINQVEWFVNFTDKEFSPYKRKKMEKFFENRTEPMPENFLMVDVIPAELLDWLDPAKIYDWAKVDAIKLPSNGKAATKLDGRPSGSYSGWVKGQNSGTILAADIDTGAPLFYCHGQWHPGLTHVRKSIPDCTIIGLSANRIAKFTRDFPMAQELGAYMKQQARAWQKGLSEQDKLIIQLHCNSRILQVFSKLDASKIDDPEIVKCITASKASNGSKLYDEWHLWDDWTTLNVKDFKNPLDKYPLLGNTYYGFNLASKTYEHLYLYVNAVYAAGKEV